MSYFEEFEMAGASKRRRSYDGKVTKKARLAMVAKTPRSGEVRMQRKFLLGTWIWSNASPSGFWRAYNPTLNDMPGTERNEITGSYDQYKFHNITITLVPRYTNFDAGSSVVNPVPIISYYPDVYNAPSAPAGTYGASSYERFAARANKDFPTALGSRVITCKYRPTVQSSDGEIKPFPWTTVLRTDVAANAAQFYIHAVNFANLASTSEYDVFVTMDMSCRGFR